MRADHAVGVEPHVVDAHLDQPPQPRFRDQVDVRLADAGRHADQQAVAAAGLEAVERLGQHLHAAAPLVADDLGALDADERRDVPELARAAGRCRR